MQWLPAAELLTFEEIERVARVVRRALRRSTASASPAASPRCGPTCRCSSSKLRRRCGVDLALTTNGATLRPLADDLAAAGLRRINISLDSLRRDRFREHDPARRAATQVLDGHRRRARGRPRPGEGQRRGHAGRERRRDRRLRPLRPRAGRRRALHRVHAARRRRALDRRPGRRPATRSSTPSTPCSRSSRSTAGARTPAERFRYRDGGGEIGVIASVTQPFCATCDRVRLTAEGQFRNCLFALDENDLRALAARRRRPTTSWPRRSPSAAWPRSGPGTRSARCTSSGRAASMSQIGG